MQKLIFLIFGFVLLFSFSESGRVARAADGSGETSSESNLEAAKKRVGEYIESAQEMLSEAGKKVRETANNGKDKLGEIVGKAKDGITRMVHGSSTEEPNE